MKLHDMPGSISGSQMNLMFERRIVDGMSDKERTRAITIIAQLMMQAAGLTVEELDDDRR
ncbi:hypothetical protein [Pseudoruegeria sp. SK021]|uniref:hypothetical protein n=1 Tax=Pseudoruegeria sp. SK021 TaxID=1933035 RepID=UPI000A25DB91|nr:hypothetical protein [Pseudoruegeria sp. SK021]OSP54758.1 hypothetical protein BV911_11395 [Pseudoruegeria sp. SK021]